MLLCLRFTKTCALDCLFSPPYIANIRERVGNGRQYVVQWPDGNAQVQVTFYLSAKFQVVMTLIILDLACGISNNSFWNENFEMVL